MSRNKIILCLLITFFNWSFVFSSSAQNKVSSKGVTAKASAKGILELKIVETDPILKLAKETVPFDRVFFLKVKRPKRGTNVEITTTRVKKTDSTETLNPSPNLEVKTSVSREYKGPLEKEKTISPPSQISTIILEPRKNPETKFSRFIFKVLSKKPKIKQEFINYDIYPNNRGKVYEENNNSEFVYIEMPNLRPDKGYDLAVSWIDGLDTSKETYSFTTIPNTIDKRLRQQVIPQLGVASPIFTNEKGKISLEPSLMLGFYIHPRSIDPDIPFYNYSYFSLQRLSYFAGLTINSIAEENVRSDLIGTNNIMLGIGYQPFNAVRVSYGALLFSEINPNKLMIDRKSLAVTSYVAITIDIKLKDILGGVVTTLGFK